MESAAIGWVLRQIVQISIVALSVYGAVRWFAWRRPRFAHGLWLLVLVKALTPPVFGSPFAPLGQLDRWVTAWLRTQPLQAEIRWDDVSLSDSSEGADGVHVSAPGKLLEPDAGRLFSDVRDEELGPEEPLAEPIHGSYWGICLLGLWFVTSTCVACRMLVRLMEFQRAARRTTVETPDWVWQLVQSLRERLKLVRAVRVRVVDAPIGPAVIGWWRPTIVLPQALLARGAATELEPLLAHEMIHVRRGDLSWSLVQAAATIVWWFHPLVRIASQSMEREAERCCDDETIATLACSPARYARSLLDVLEQKHHLRTAPVFPGVRPLDITSERMERIMRQGHGSHRARSGWSRALLAVIAIAILPGTAWVEESARIEIGSSAQPQDHLVRDSQVVTGRANVVALPGDSNGVAVHDDAVSANEPLPATIVIRSYEVGSLIKKLCDEQKLDRRSIEAEIAVPLPGFVPHNDKQLSARLPKMEIDLPGHGRLELGGEGRSSHVVGDTLYVVGDPAMQEAFQKSLAAMERYGLRQVAITTRLVTIAADKLKTLNVGWESLVQPASETGLNPITPASPIASPVHVTLAALLDATEAKRLREEFQADPRVNILQAPRVTVFNGQSATIRDARERPFVVAVDSSQKPQVRGISEGTEIQVQPELQEDSQQVQLSLLLQHSTIVRVDELTFRHVGAKSGEGTTLQVPQIHTQQIEVRQFALGLDQTLLLGAIPMKFSRNDQGLMLVMVDVDVIEGAR